MSGIQHTQMRCRDTAAPLPTYSPVGVLRPITSVATARYGKSPSLYSYHTAFIPPGPHSAPSSLDMPTKWKSHSHPEGQLKPMFIGKRTEAPGGTGWLKFIDDTILQQQIIVPPSSELFIELDESPFSCAYYFVNHDTRRIFWLEEISSELLDMGTIVSTSILGCIRIISPVTYPHMSATTVLKTVLVHVEFFPMHMHAQVSPQVVDDLIGVMSHGCSRPLDLAIVHVPVHCGKNVVNCLFTTISMHEVLDAQIVLSKILRHMAENQRFMTYYVPRACPTRQIQIMVPEEDMDHQWVKTLANPVLWGIPDRYFSELHDLFTNEQVFRRSVANFHGCMYFGVAYSGCLCYYPLLPLISSFFVICPAIDSLGVWKPRHRVDPTP
ncbi:hypothetical protein EDB19DRAFT_1826874 [Suillus lakei]|nr:hypothetical protein EDB19DRAFT_1826874 [Suillus lakei]